MNSIKQDRKLYKLERHLLKKMGRAMFDYDMVKGGERVLAAVSGGKDSLTLLRLMTLNNKILPPSKKYTIVGAHINFKFCGNQSGDFSPLFEQYGIEYHAENADLPEKRDKKLSDVFWCAWNKRKLLFNMAERHSCTKIAFGHHLDDIVVTLLMNQFYYGEISTMPPKVSMFGGKLHIIRPLAYIPEKLIVEYVKKSGIEHVSCKCPFAKEDSRREAIKGIINIIEKNHGSAKINLFRSMRKIKTNYLA